MAAAGKKSTSEQDGNFSLTSGGPAVPQLGLNPPSQAQARKLWLCGSAQVVFSYLKDTIPARWLGWQRPMGVVVYPHLEGSILLGSGLPATCFS